MSRLHVDPQGRATVGYPVDVRGETYVIADSELPRWTYCAVGEKFVAVWNNVGDAYVVELGVGINNLRPGGVKPQNVNFW